MNISDTGFQFQRLSNQTVRQNQGVDSTDAKGEVSGNAKVSLAQEGQVFQGQVTDVQGDQVSIRMQDNAMLHARLGEEVGLNIGDELNFLVKENDGSSVVIKPFMEGAEVMKDNAIFKVLEGNNLSPSAKNYQIAETLMKQNMGVDKASMQRIMQQSYKYPDASIDTLVSMNKMGMTVNEANINQYESYVNNQHQVMQGLQDLSESMIEFASKEVLNLASGEDGLNFQMDFLQTLSEPGDMPNVLMEQNLELSADISMNNGTGIEAEVEVGIDAGVESGIEAYTEIEIVAQNEESALNDMSAVKDATQMMEGKFNIDSSVAENFTANLENLGLSKEVIRDAVAKSDNSLQLLNNVNELLHQLSTESGIDSSKLQEFLSSDTYKNIIGKAIKEKFSLDPKEMKDPNEVSDLYKRIYEKTEQLMQRFGSSGGSAGQNMSEQAKSMQERIDFMQNLSEMYAYAQLPVRVDGTDHNSDLFVYMNKKRLQQNKEDVSALLHLDMDFLGPTDVHVSLRGSTVHTKFYVEDEISAKIIDEHMNSLEKAINENGFSLSNEVIMREPTLDKSKNPVVDEVLGNNLEQSVKRYSFDVRT